MTRATTIGWSHVAADGKRTYILATDGPTTFGRLDARVAPDRHWVAEGDISIAWMRHEAARALARGDADLERAVRRDLWRMSIDVRLALVSHALLDGLEDLPAAEPAPAERNQGARRRRRRVRRYA